MSATARSQQLWQQWLLWMRRQLFLLQKIVWEAPDFSDIRPQERKKEELPWDVIRISLKAADIVSKSVTYDQRAEIDQRVKSLTDEELGYLAIGGFDPDAGALGIIGNAATHVAGAAGETTSVLADKGIRPLIMADGPAGIRVSRAYYEDAKGLHDASGAGMIPESMLEYMTRLCGFWR